MDIFKFNNLTSPTKMEDGEIINGLKSKMWIERYREDGEFALVADVSSGLKDKLTIGSFISHVDSTEVMIVENHEIRDDRGKETEIVITGRGFETFFDQRIVGTNKTFPSTTGVKDFSIAAAYTWLQAETLIENHIYTALLIDGNNAIPFVNVITDVSATSVSAARTIKRGPLHKRLIELLEVDDLGVKVIRPGVWSPLAPGSADLAVVIHKGVDRRDELVFSYDTGQIETADYLWSNKKEKNCAVVSGKWVEVFVAGTATQYDRRVMEVDGSWVDDNFSTAPTGTTLTDIQNIFEQLGLEALAAQKTVALTKAEVSKESTTSSYRADFNVGDIITVHGEYNQAAPMRISEYVEIEDENGRTGQPTLSAV